MKCYCDDYLSPTEAKYYTEEGKETHLPTWYYEEGEKFNERDGIKFLMSKTKKAFRPPTYYTTLVLLVTILVGCSTVTDYGQLYLTPADNRAVYDAAQTPDGRNRLMLFAIFIRQHASMKGDDETLARLTSGYLTEVGDEELRKALYNGTKRAAKSRDRYAMQQYAFEIESHLLP